MPATDVEHVEWAAVVSMVGDEAGGFTFSDLAGCRRRHLPAAPCSHQFLTS
jgi:hypothetical protein